MKFKRKIPILCLVAVTISLCFFYGLRSGKKILDYIRLNDITEIVVKKTVEDGTEIKDCGTFKLESVEIEKFYTVLSEAKVKDIGNQSF